MVYVSWSVGSTSLSTFSKMEASPLLFSDCYLNSHVNAAFKLGSKGAIASLLVEADYTGTGSISKSACQAETLRLKHSGPAVLQ